MHAARGTAQELKLLLITSFLCYTDVQTVYAATVPKQTRVCVNYKDKCEQADS